MSNFHPLEVVGRGSETKLQVGKNLNTLFKYMILRAKGLTVISFFFQELIRDFQGNTMHSPDAGVTLVHRLRRWTNINPTLGHCWPTDRDVAQWFERGASQLLPPAV